MGTVIKYSESFKRQVVDEIARGKFKSIFAARRAYGIRSTGTVYVWVRKYGSEDLYPKRIKVESMKERDEIKELKKRVRDLEAALADARIDNLLERSFLEIACERMEENVDDFKKKHGIGQLKREMNPSRR